MTFPVSKTNAIDKTTLISAAHLNNLENKVGIDNSTDANSLDYKLQHLSTIFVDFTEDTTPTSADLIITVGGEKVSIGNLFLNAPKLAVGTITGFSAMLQNIYFDPAINKIGIINPTVFTQSLLNVGIQDNTGNSQNTGLFVYESTVPFGTTTTYGNGIEGDVYHTGLGHTDTMAGVTGYSRVEDGTVDDMFSFWDGGASIRGGVVQNQASFFTSGAVVQAGHVVTGCGARFTAPNSSGTGVLDNSYGLYVVDDGNGTTLARNAYFGDGIVEVSHELLVSGIVLPMLKITGSKTLASASESGLLFYPTLTSTGDADLYAAGFYPVIVTPGGATTFSIQGLRLETPLITLGGGSTLYSSMTLYIQGDPNAGTHPYALYVDGATSNSCIVGRLAIGKSMAYVTPPQLLTLGETETIAGAVTDGYAAGLRLDPGYTAATAQTVTRHNYIDVQNVSVAGVGPAAVTNAAVFRFDAAIATHKAVLAGFNTTDSGAHTTAWAAGIIVNINGTLYKIPVIAV